jgi:Flp pilus assembly protein TadG
MIIRRKPKNGERGQVLILCAFLMTVLLLFVGLAIDFGFAYVTKAQLGKALDAAALTGARYSAQGAAKASALAQSSFAMNYGTPSSGTVPVPAVTYSTDANGNKLIGVSATATINTSFISLAGMNTIPVSSTAQAKAAKVEMTLVLDRSGSMKNDGGEANLPTAVQTFINYFDNTSDSVALVSFAGTATTNVPMMTGGFQQPIINAANGLTYNQSTFSDAALQAAFTQELQPVRGNVLKVVVFFTDGGANTIQNSLICTGGSVPSGTWDIGGQDPPSTNVGFMTPATGVSKGCSISGNSNNCCTPGTFPSASQAGALAPAWSASGPLVTPWTNGTPAPINYNNVQADALYRAIGDANAMRLQGITVYSIGLGSAPAPADPAFLCQVANDPTCSPAGTYNPAMPAGVMQWAPTGADLPPAFQAIATIIRLRMTQ